MKKKYQILYIWSFIIIASFILLLLYTPIGGGLINQPSPKVYNVMNKSVRFDGMIANSPKIKSSNQSVGTENEIPSASEIPNFNRNRNSYLKNKRQQSGSEYAAITNNTENSNTSSGMGGSLAVLGGRTNNSNSAENSYSTNLNQPFSDQSLAGGSMQKAPALLSNPHDPGGEPIGAPLPVGDGLPYLIGFSILYILYIYKFRLKIS